MIELHTAGTPNGKKVSIFLEEAGLPYRVNKIDLGGGQFAPAFLAISPNNKIPAIVDTNGPGGEKLSLFESGAILIYLAEKTGRFLSNDPATRASTIQWLMWQMGGLGPMMGQNYHFQKAAPEKIPYAIERYIKETDRLFGVMDRRLAGAQYLAGDYSIADMAAYPWAAGDWHGVDTAKYPNFTRWRDAIGARPAVIKGMAVP
jgi:GSH-dependent disulfide-bond oxidoreductase